jgi:hypothetical protein
MGWRGAEEYCGKMHGCDNGLEGQDQQGLVIFNVVQHILLQLHTRRKLCDASSHHSSATITVLEGLSGNEYFHGYFLRV